MRTWSVTARGLAAVQVQGRNWIVALGRGLEELGRVPDLTRLACEVLPNGTVIARDIATGTGYVVQTVDEESAVRRPASKPPGVLPAAFGDVEPASAEERQLLPKDAAEGAHESPTSSGEEEGELVMTGEPEDDDDDTAAEPIYDLPPDAIDDLSMDESPYAAILAAETAAQACQIALDTARLKVPAESGAVILEERGYLRFLAVDGPASRKLVGVRLPLGTGVAGFAMEKRRNVVIADAHDDPRHCGEVDALTGYVTREMCVVPVIHEDRVLGVLELMNLPGGRRFGDPEIEAMTEVANALAERLAH